MSIQYIRDHYGVPAKVRGRVKIVPVEGAKDRREFCVTITGTRGAHLLVRLDHAVVSRPYHPFWQIEYLPVSASSTPDTLGETKP